MRVYLTAPELSTDVGQSLLVLCQDIAADGVLDLAEIKTLRRWLREHASAENINAVCYLSDIMHRITADGVVDRDEQVELQLAIERVIPVALRKPATQARKVKEAERRARRLEKRRIQRENQLAELERQATRLRFIATSVAGITFPNDDGTERQQIAVGCQIGERLSLVHDPSNPYSEFATRVLRSTGNQLGHLPESVAEEVFYLRRMASALSR